MTQKMHIVCYSAELFSLSNVKEVKTITYEQAGTVLANVRRVKAAMGWTGTKCATFWKHDAFGNVKSIRVIRLKTREVADAHFG